MSLPGSRFVRHGLGLWRVAAAVLALGAPSGTFAADGLQQQILYTSGTGGYHAFRIPALVVSNAGTMLAFAEGRYQTLNDRAVSDMVLRRSFDNGQTWEDTQIVVPGLAGEFNYNCPTPIVDRITGDIVMPFVLDASRVFVTRSSDDGATWSAPEEITAQVKDPAWGFYAPGPGHAIQLASGRLLVAAYHREIMTTNGVSTAHSFYSDDHGLTWQLGGSTDTLWGNESSVVELVNGDVSMISRIRSGLTARGVAISEDGGETWLPSSVTTQLGIVNVQGSSIRLSDEVNDDANRILYSSPMGSNDREMMTVATSYDETQSWTNPRTVYWSNAAYSDLAISQDRTINLIYERGRENTPGYENLYQEIALAQFDQEWLENGPDYRVTYEFAEQSSGTASPLDGRIKDSSGWDMHAQALGGPTYVAGAPTPTLGGLGGDGYAMRFTAGADKVVLDKDETGSFFYLGPNQSFSIEAMFRTTAHTSGGFGQGGVLMSRGDNTTDSYWALQVDNGRLRFVYRDALFHTRTMLAGSGLSDGEWHHVVAVRDAEERLFKLYLNDELILSRADDVAMLFNDDDILIGQWADGSRQFVGDIDFVSFMLGAYVPVPEPSTLALLAIGAVALGHKVRRRRVHRRGA